MLDAYFGEFLVSGIPLEMALNWCSHACQYCYANLNQPDRKANPKRVLNLLRDYPNRRSVPAMLLQQGYPVLISNRVDPFAHSNYQVALSMIRTLVDMEIDIAFQTKGGRGIDDTLAMIKPSSWYVSIAFQGEALCKQIEPGAPPLSERYALVETLAKAGQSVVVGLNPLVPEWVPEPLAILERIRDAGATGVWIERLHLSPRQITRMTDSGRAAMGDDLLASARKKIDDDHFMFFLDVRLMAEMVGLEVYSKNQPNPSAFFEPMKALYRKLFPTMQDWVNVLHTDKPDGGLVTFDEFAQFFAGQLPSGEHPLDSYLGATVRTLWRTHTIPTEMTYTQLLALIWQEPRISTHPANSPAFARAMRGDEPIQDARGMPVMWFMPGFTWAFEQCDTIDVSEVA